MKHRLFAKGTSSTQRPVSTLIGNILILAAVAYILGSWQQEIEIEAWDGHDMSTEPVDAYAKKEVDSTRPRFLRRSDEDHDEQGSSRLRVKEHHGKGNLTHDILSAWEKSCESILKSDRDYVEYEEGKLCWASCQDALSVFTLQGFVGRIQASIQSKPWVRMLFPHVPHVPQSISSFLICLLIVLMPICPHLFLDLSPDNDSSGVFCSFVVIWMYVRILMPILSAWFAFVLGTVVWAQSLTTARQFQDIMNDQKNSWAAPWAEPALLFNNGIVSSFVIFYIIFQIVLVCLFIQCMRWRSATNRFEAFFENLVIFPAVWSCLNVLFLCFIVAQFSYSAGSHGMHWSCAKSFFACKLGWLPSDAPYKFGLFYSIASVIHGLLITAPKIKPMKLPDQRRKSWYVVPDTIHELIMLLSKTLAMLVDILLDMAQSMMFFCRGQPFFGFFNIAGILIQMVMLICAAAQGVARDIGFVSTVLQSDLVANFRSSFEIGMITWDLHEKTYRESFGETFLSMGIGITSFFTMQFRYASDLQLMLLSSLMSMNSIRTGMAESREFVEAEQETGTCCISIIPRNDFYARKVYSRQRSMKMISTLRMSEALLLITTLAVGIGSGSASATYVCSVVLCAAMFLPRYLWKFGKCFREFASFVFSNLQRDESEEAIGAWIGRLLPQIIVVLAICLAWLVCFIVLLASPILTMNIVLFWNQSLTIPRTASEESTMNENTIITDLFKLLYPNKLVCLMDNFAQAYITKISYVIAMWAVYAGATYWDKSWFDLAREYAVVERGLRSSNQVHWWHSMAKSIILAGSCFSLVVIVVATYILHNRRGNWHEELERARFTAEDLLRRKTLPRVEAILRVMSSKGYTKLAKCEDLGIVKHVRDVGLHMLVAVKILDYFFGSSQRNVVLPVWLDFQTASHAARQLEAGNEKWLFEMERDSHISMRSAPEALQTANTIYSQFPRLMYGRYSLLQGGDLVIVDDLDAHAHLPLNYDAPRLILNACRRERIKGGRHIIINVSCKACQMPNLENTLRELVSVESAEARSFGALGEQLRAIAGDLLNTTKSDLFQAILSDALPKIEDMQSCLSKIADLLHGASLSSFMEEFNMFEKDSRHRISSIGDDEFPEGEDFSRDGRPTGTRVDESADVGEEARVDAQLTSALDKLEQAVQDAPDLTLFEKCWKESKHCNSQTSDQHGDQDE